MDKFNKDNQLDNWWKKATVYQIYVRSFNDSNGDGIGDIKGITEKLDYLSNLGADLLWITPIYVSPQRDNGYDIADYFNIEPQYGTMKDFEELIEKAHQKYKDNVRYGFKSYINRALLV